MKSIYIFASFMGGALIGICFGCRFAKKKYEQIANEEIESVVHEFKNREEKRKQEEAEAPKQTKKPETIKEYVNKIHENGYSEKKESRYVIPPDQFGEVGYEEISLYYHSDGTLTEAETGTKIEDIDDLVGLDALDHLGEYELNSVYVHSVYVRDDDEKRDYEILLVDD